MEVRGFEPRTPCMPSARSRFDCVRHRTFCLQQLDNSLGSVHINPCGFASTAEVTAEASTSAVTSASLVSTFDASIATDMSSKIVASIPPELATARYVAPRNLRNVVANLVPVQACQIHTVRLSFRSTRINSNSLRSLQLLRSMPRYAVTCNIHVRIKLLNQCACSA